MGERGHSFFSVFDARPTAMQQQVPAIFEVLSGSTDTVNRCTSDAGWILLLGFSFVILYSGKLILDTGIYEEHELFSRHRGSYVPNQVRNGG